MSSKNNTIKAQAALNRRAFLRAGAWGMGTGGALFLLAGCGGSNNGGGPLSVPSTIATETGGGTV